MDENIWAGFVPFRSIPYTQDFLQTCYRRRGLEKPKMKSYRNSYSFVYYLEHAKRHYDLARLAPFELQPLLLFYGMTQLVKACLLTVDPDYPRTAAVLAHGVSTRKRKRQDYTFSTDEIRIQKHGLTAYFAAELFQLEHTEGKKFHMKDLLERIPDLNDLFLTLSGSAPFYQITIKNERTVEIPAAILDDLHMTLPRFLTFLQTHTSIHFGEPLQTKKTITLKLENRSQPFPASHDGLIYLPRAREHYDGLPEILVHFLLLYNLSMICRYETEWWSELFHYASGEDLPFIESFLRLTAEKVPFMTIRFLRRLM